MPSRKVWLDEVKTRRELASALGVPVPAIDAVSLSTEACRNLGCSLFAAEGNNGRCILCSQTWFPREHDKKGNPARNRRGYGLFGPQFLPTFGTERKGCACASPLCEKLGYSHSGMFRFPNDPTKCAEAVRVLGIPSSQRQRIIDAPRSFRISPWHFDRRHRVRDSNGKWRL